MNEHLALKHLPFISRRDMLTHTAAGFGMLGLAGVCAAEQESPVKSPSAAGPSAAGVGSPLTPKPSHFVARAKHVIFLFMNGGPSHVDTFDPKPELKKQAG